MSEDRAARPRVVVVGAGIAGLSAAHELAADGRAEVVVLEGSPRTGGKLLRGEVGGVATDLGAEALLARRPEALALLDELGLGGEVVHPVTTQARVWSRGALRALPAGHVMGVPTRVRALARSGVVPPAGVARAALDLALPGKPLEGDVSVGSFVGARMGRAVVDRLVEPLLGGVYAGRADALSLRATLPAVAAVAGTGSIMRSLRAKASPGTGPKSGSGAGPKSGSGAGPKSGSGAGPKSGAAPAPVFAGLPGGVGRLAEALTESLSARGVVVRLDSTVRSLHRAPSGPATPGGQGGWRLVVGSAAAPEEIAADAVVLAVPAAPASRLLGGCVPVAAEELADIEYASMAIVTMAFEASAFEKPFQGSGFLVPAVEGRLVKAATFSSAKWGWYPDRMVVARCSIGRFGDARELQRDDGELMAGAARDLAEMAGARGAPADAVITRWGGALPQYNVGHLDRVARIKAAISSAAASLAVCGAAYDGVGIPACIGSGRAAATRIRDHLFGAGQ